ncbi:MAG: recombinase family protein [Kiritimatiellae bacterium]|nr:recombinase family protein [Kiritimatiellia bacterium]
MEMVFGYIRASHKTQEKNSFEYQRRELIKHGVPEENIFADCISGKNFENREALDELLEKLELLSRAGVKTKLIVRELSRLGRNTTKALQLIEQLQSLGVELTTLSEGITLDSSPMGKCFATCILAFATAESDLRAERCALGLKNAKEKGAKLGRPKASNVAVEEAIALYKDNPDMPVREISEKTGISVPTIYRAVKDKGIRHRK